MSTRDRSFRVKFVLISLLILGLSACSNDLPASEQDQSSQSVFSDDGVSNAHAEFLELTQSNNRAGVVSLFVHNGAVEHVFEYGWSSIEDERKMTADTVVRIASMTKPITAAAIMILVEEGKLTLNTPLSTFIPEFKNVEVVVSPKANDDGTLQTRPAEREITIEDLLTHTSGLGYVFDERTSLGRMHIDQDLYLAKGLSVDERMKKLASLPLYFDPGTSWFYSYSNDVLGYVITKASGLSLEDFFKNQIFQPLGMKHTSFYSSRIDASDIASMYTHDENAALILAENDRLIPRIPEWEAGGAGLFSTANDYLKFAQMLANSGQLNDVEILSEDSVSKMTAVHVGADALPDTMDDKNMGFGYSLAVTYDGVNTTTRRVGDFGWAGYFDTGFIISPSTNTVGIVISQEQPGAGTRKTKRARDVFEKLYTQSLN